MDSGSTVATPSRKRQKSNEGKDIISNLPQPIISHILYCVSIRDAIRTSVLSKAWISRWTRVTKLKFDDKKFYSSKKNTGKQNFVNKTLLLTRSVESFHLVISNKYDPSLVNTWILSILRSYVKNLRVRSHLELDFSVVSSHLLFNANLLKELVLKMHRCAIRVTKDSYIYFGRLELLEFSGITFTFDFSNHSRDLRFRFPVLKELKTKNCNWLSATCVTFEAPQLVTFFIEQSTKSQSEESRNCAIKICASNLAEFTFRGRVSQDILLVDPLSARGATANIILYKCGVACVQEVGLRVCKLLKQFSQVKCLKLEGTEVLAKSKVSLTVMPHFGMSNHLELDLVNGEILLGLLHKSPVLKTLDSKGLSKFDEEILNSGDVPKCFLSTLEVVKFGRISGSKHELCLAKFVVENSLVLKRMSFSHSSWPTIPKAIEEFKEKLFSFKKSFNLAIIDFYVCY